MGQAILSPAFSVLDAPATGYPQRASKSLPAASLAPPKHLMNRHDDATIQLWRSNLSAGDPYLVDSRRLPPPVGRTDSDQRYADPWLPAGRHRAGAHDLVGDRDVAGWHNAEPDPPDHRAGHPRTISSDAEPHVSRLGADCRRHES